jgi:hypothetical protein
MPSLPPSPPFVLRLSQSQEADTSVLDAPAISAPAIDDQKKGKHSRNNSEQEKREQEKDPKRRRESEPHKTDLAPFIPVQLPHTHKSDLAVPIPVALIPPLNTSVELYGHSPATLPLKPPAHLALPYVPKTNSAQKLTAVALAKPNTPQIKQQPAAAKRKAPIAPIIPSTPAANPSPPIEESHSLVARLAKKVLNPRAATAKAAATQLKPAAPATLDSTQTQTVSAAKAAPIKPAIKKAAPSAAVRVVKFPGTPPQTPPKSFDDRNPIAVIDDLLATHKKKKAAPAAALAAKQEAKDKERERERGQIKIDLEKATATSSGNPWMPSPFGK